MNQKTKSLLIGIAAGAALGGALAWVASDGGDSDSGEPTGIAALGPGDYIQLFISILTLARQFSSMLR